MPNERKHTDTDTDTGTMHGNAAGTTPNHFTASASASASASFLRARGDTGKVAGRPARGLYPEFDRTKIAAVVGKDLSTVTGYLKGQHTPPLEVLVKIAGVVGVEVQVLVKELGEEQGKWKNRGYKTAASAAAGKRATAGKSTRLKK